MARRVMADTWLYSSLRSLCASLEQLVPAPAGKRLAWDPHLPFLREDAKDAAEINATNAQAVRSLTEAGYEPTSVVAAVMANDLTLLTHTGVFSVQLQPPGSNSAPPAE
jgi:hypothetical protein